MFAVAHFVSTSEVDVVPVSWLNETTGKDGECMCFWPPYKTLGKIQKAKMTGDVPTDQWSLHSVKCLYTAGEHFSIVDIWVFVRQL